LVCKSIENLERVVVTAPLQLVVEVIVEASSVAVAFVVVVGRFSVS